MKTNIKKWNIKEDPVAFYVKKKGPSSENPLPLYIPVLMALMPKVKKKTKKVSISKGCYINDITCRPTIASSIKTQTYIDVKVNRKAEFEKSTFLFDAKLQLKVDRDDENRLEVTDKLDPSIDL